jgi:hypothetical protein
MDINYKTIFLFMVFIVTVIVFLSLIDYISGSNLFGSFL